MAPSIDGITSFPASIEPIAQPSAAAGDESNSFSEHLQEASRAPVVKSRTSKTERRTPAREKTDSPPSVTPSKDPRTDNQKGDEKSATAVSADDKAERDKLPPAPTDVDSKDEPSGDKTLPIALQIAQLLVPAVVQLPIEAATHSEVVAVEVTPPEANPKTATVQTTKDMTATAIEEALASASKPLSPTAGIELVTRRDVTSQQLVTARTTSPAPTQITSQAAIQAANAAAVQLSAQEQIAVTTSDDNSSKNSPSKNADLEAVVSPTLANDVMQVVVPVAPAVSPTTTTIVSSGSERATSHHDPKIKDVASDKQESSAPDHRASLDQTAPPDAGQPRHSRFSLDAHPSGTSSTDGGPRLTEAERARFVQRVTRAVQTAADTGSPIRLRLSPPELGSMRLEIHVADGQMSARIETETQQARTALLDNLPALRDRLEQQDIKITRFDVNLFNGAGGNSYQSPQRDLGQDAPMPRHTLPGGELAAVSVESSPAESRASISQDGRLNVVI